MTIVEALKSLVTAIGGTYTADDDTISEMIAEAAKAFEQGGGGGLPAVSGADNGDVLTVVEGAWAKADPPTELPAVSGTDNGNVLTVVAGAWAIAAPPEPLVMTATHTSASTLTVDTTPTQLAAAVAAKRQVYIYSSVDIGQDDPSQTMIPLRQVIGTQYDFSAIIGISTKNYSVTVVSIRLGVEDGVLKGTTLVRVIDTDAPSA